MTRAERQSAKRTAAIFMPPAPEGRPTSRPFSTLNDHPSSIYATYHNQGQVVAMSAHRTSTATTLIMISSPPGSLTVFLFWAVRSRLPRTGGLRSRPHPGPGAFASGRAASGAGCDCPAHCSSAASSGLTAGLLHGLHPLPVQGRPKRAVRSAARHLVFDRPLRGRKEASASAHATRPLRSGFRLLQPAPVNCRPLPQPQLGEPCSAHSRPFPRASLVWSVCSVWPSKAVQTLHPDQSDPRPAATFRHELDRQAHWRWNDSRKIQPRSRSGFAAAAGVHHWITP